MTGPILHSLLPCLRVPDALNPCQLLGMPIYFLIFSHSERGVIVSDYGFNSHFINEKLCGMSFHVLTFLVESVL